ncbi:MAG: ATP-binding protein [FCB group bacterium]|nr:ATP-binding protein [FCB group bacterium]
MLRLTARKKWQPYALAAGVFALFLAVAFALYPFVQSTTGIFLMLAIIFAVRFCGTGPALMNLALMVVCVDYFLTTPRFVWGTKANDTIWLSIFIVLSLTIILLGQSLKRASRATRESDISFLTVLSSIGDAVITTDNAGRVVFMNQIAEKLLQVSKDDARMMPLHRLINLLDEKTRTPENLPLSKAVKENAIPLGNGYVLVAPDQKEHLIEASASPLRDEGGKRQGLVIVFRDVTARRHAERAMQESSVFARFTLDALSANICVLDEQGNIVAVNKSWRHFARTHGLNVPDNGAGANYLTACDRAAFEGVAEAQAFANAIRNILAGKQETYACEYSIVASNKEYWFLGRVTRFPGLSMRRAVVTHEDITSLKQAQRELQELNETLEQRVAQRTEEVLRAQEALSRGERLAVLGQMTAVLSHESRNALQRIQTAMDLLERRLRNDADAVRLIRETRRAQDDLRRVHEEVRGYAAPLILDLSPNNVIEVWRQAWTSLESLRAGRLAALIETCDVPDTICNMDAFRMQQVFRNLLENALAACEDPVQIFIHCTTVKLDGLDALRISVRDNGPGITAEQQTSFFEPFYTTKARGTGLGTAIAKRVVEAHGGRIWTEPPTGRGLEIVLVLPKDPALLIPPEVQKARALPS